MKSFQSEKRDMKKKIHYIMVDVTFPVWSGLSYESKIRPVKQCFSSQDILACLVWSIKKKSKYTLVFGCRFWFIECSPHVHHVGTFGEPLDKPGRRFLFGRIN